MTFLSLSLVLTAAFCHATWNLLVKRINGGPELVWLFSVFSVLIYLPIVAGVYLLERPLMAWREVGFYVGSAALHMAYFLLLQQGYRRGDLSLVYPVARATGPFLSTLFAVSVLGENLTVQIAVGALAIIVGIVFLTGGFDWTSTRRVSSLLFGVSTGVLIGSYTVWDAYAVSALAIPPLLLDYGSMLARALFLAPYAVTRRKAVVKHWREHKLAVLGIAVFTPLAYILVLTALVFTPIVYVAPGREVSVLITVAMGSILLGEGELRRRMGWACLILLGMVMLVLG
ncbi:MAG: hypothetical protein F4X91_14675 [Nitrospinae bacterium]|nr:hypothetical protein [Nitrospinota bacterium]